MCLERFKKKVLPSNILVVLGIPLLSHCSAFAQASPYTAHYFLSTYSFDLPAKRKAEYLKVLLGSTFQYFSCEHTGEKNDNLRVAC